MGDGEIVEVALPSRDPSDVANAGSSRMAPIGCASDAGSLGGTNRAVSPSTAESGMPPTPEATTGLALLIASRITLNGPSASDGRYRCGYRSWRRRMALIDVTWDVLLVLLIPPGGSSREPE